MQFDHIFANKGLKWVKGVFVYTGVLLGQISIYTHTQCTLFGRISGKKVSKSNTRTFLIYVVKTAYMCCQFEQQCLNALQESTLTYSSTNGKKGKRIGVKSHFIKAIISITMPC